MKNLIFGYHCFIIVVNCANVARITQGCKGQLLRSRFPQTHVLKRTMWCH